MSLNSGIEAVLAAIGIEIAKLVVEKYKNNTSTKELSEKEQDEYSTSDDKSINESSEQQYDPPP
ncbi:MAG: hypothetical protein JXA98_06765 [Methanosarcinaceae archaeon]|nr:hypothetical protein [Methanosarcinaceae archaeon]